jgi:hypothetical protein
MTDAISFKGVPERLHCADKPELGVAKVRGWIEAAVKASPSLIRPNAPCRLLTKKARFLGFEQSAWSDDNYTVIPYEGEPDAESEKTLDKFFYKGMNGYSRRAWIDRDNKHIVIYEYCGIGD